MNRCTIALSALLALAVVDASAQSSNGTVLNRIAAVVNEGVVLQTELDSQVMMIARQLREQGTSLPSRSVLEEQVMETLIVQQIQLQRAAQRGISISDERLNAALRQVAERNGLSLSQLPAAMASEGVDYGRYREEMRKEMIIDSLRQIEVFSGIAVSEREIARFLDREEASASDLVDYDISHILVAVDQDAQGTTLDDAELRVNQIHERLLNGEDFAEVAVAYSDGQRALDGGKLGWRKGAQLPQFLEEIVANLEPGEISYPVRSPSGFHIVRINDVRGSERTLELQTRARHILIRPNEVMDDESVREKLLQLRERIDRRRFFRGHRPSRVGRPGLCRGRGRPGLVQRGNLSSDLRRPAVPARQERGQPALPHTLRLASRRAHRTHRAGHDPGEAPAAGRTGDSYRKGRTGNGNLAAPAARRGLRRHSELTA